jgi:hypothetical protein
MMIDDFPLPSAPTGARIDSAADGDGVEDRLKPELDPLAQPKDPSLADVLRMLLMGNITCEALSQFRCFAQSATSALLLPRLYLREITAAAALLELRDDNYLLSPRLADLLRDLLPMEEQPIEDVIVEDDQRPI